MRLLLLLPLIYGCDGSIEYEQGFEAGCVSGQYDAQSCSVYDDRMADGLDDLTTPYSNGLYDGYESCYEAWSEVWSSNC